MADHFGSQFAIGPALAVVAEAISTLRIGALVWQNELRHPTLVAQEAVTLDVLSSGRFEPGIGAGGSIPGEYRRTGIPLEPASRRAGRLDENIRILEGLMTRDVLVRRRALHLCEVSPPTGPVQRPHPPLVIAAGGQRMLRLAAREADIISLFPVMSGGEDARDEVGLEAFAAKVALVWSAAATRFATIELNILIQTLEVTDDRAGAIERIRKERQLTDDAWFESPMVFVCSIPEIVERTRTVRDRHGVSYFVVFEHWMESFAPIVAALAGR